METKEMIQYISDGIEYSKDDILSYCDKAIEGMGIDQYDAYIFGSQVYGTAEEDSDIDICIISEQFDWPQDRENALEIGPCDIKFLPRTWFHRLLMQHEISVIEMLYTPEDYILKKDLNIFHGLPFFLDVVELRHSISQKSSNSWVKCKKKLLLPEEDDLIGIKSLYHAFRIVEFGTQLARDGIISDFTAANSIYHEVIGEYYARVTEKDIGKTVLWSKLSDIFKERFNKARTEFRKYAPKE